MTKHTPTPLPETSEALIIRQSEKIGQLTKDRARLDRLAAENLRLREALHGIAFAPYRSGVDQDIARAALKGSKEGKP